MGDLHLYTDFDDDIADGFADELHSIANLPDSEIALPLITLINHLLYFAQDALIAYNMNSLGEDEDLEALRDEAHTNLIINIQWRLEDKEEGENECDT